MVSPRWHALAVLAVAMADTASVYPQLTAGARPRRRRRSSSSSSQSYWNFLRRRSSRLSSFLQTGLLPEAIQDEIPEKRDPPLQVFRRMARLVRLLCGVCIAIRKYAIDAGFLENYTVQVSRKAHGKGADEEDLTFNLKDFKLRKELRVPRPLQALLEKPPDQRTPADITAICRLMRGLHSFRKYTREMQEMLCGIIRYMRCGKSRVVLRKGHIGYNLYFIYSGCVSVVLDKDEGNVFVKPEVVFLRRGACFGEIALLQSVRRTATIVCSEETEFLWVDKDDFVARGLDQRMQQEFVFRYHFFRHWPALVTWSDEEIRGLSYVSRMEEFHHNKVIVKDSRKNEWLWFIVRGSCDILRLVELNSCTSFHHAVLSGRCAEQYVTGKPNIDKRARPKSAQSRPKITPVEALASLTSHTVSDSTLRPQTSMGFSGHRTGSSKQAASSQSVHALKSRSVSGTIPEDKDGELRATVDDSSQQTQPARSLSAADAGCGIFVKVDTLRDGQCFETHSSPVRAGYGPPVMNSNGLDNIFEDRADVVVSLVSQGCEVIHVPRPKFIEMSDHATLNNIRAMLKNYPPDDDLCDRFLEKSRWDAFKQEVVEKVVSEQQRSVSFRETLRTSKRTEYLHCLDEDATLHEWLMSRTASPLTSFSSITTRDVKQGSNVSPTKVRPETAHPTPVKKASATGTPVTASAVMSSSPKASKRTRPKTCPPRLRLKTAPLVATAGRTKPRLPAAAALGEGGALQTTTFVTKKGYKVQQTDLFASGSRRTLNLVQTVKSPSHENRMKMLRMA